MDQERPQVSVATFAQAQLAYPSPGAGLSWHQSEPSGEFTTRLESVRIAYDLYRRREWPQFADRIGSLAMR